MTTHDRINELQTPTSIQEADAFLSHTESIIQGQPMLAALNSAHKALKILGVLKIYSQQNPIGDRGFQLLIAAAEITAEGNPITDQELAELLKWTEEDVHEVKNRKVIQQFVTTLCIEM